MHTRLLKDECVATYITNKSKNASN